MPQLHRLTPETARMLAAHIEARGESMIKVARGVGISPSYLSKLKSARAAPSVVVAERLATYLEFSPEAREAFLAEAIEGVGYDWKPGLKSSPPPERPAPHPHDEAWLAEFIAAARQVNFLPELPPRWVYLARLGEDAYKIGVSVNPWSRVQSFYGELVAVLPGGRPEEERLHALFSEYRIERNGAKELYRPEGSLAEFIVSVAGVGLECEHRVTTNDTT